MPAEVRLLLVEDNPGDARLVWEALREARHTRFVVHRAGSLAEARRILAREPVEVVLLDLDLPDSWGCATVTELIRCAPGRAVVVQTGSATEETGLEAIKCGAQDYLVKGSFSPGTLERTLAYAIERKSIGEELRRAREREVAVSSRIQQSLLFGSPPADLRGIACAALAVPSEHVDGDFYDFMAYGDACVDILLGDVMGKGIPAALLGAATKSHFLRAHGRLLHARGGAGLPAPDEIVAAVSRSMVEELMRLESFVTLCYARVDAVAGVLRFVDCGHAKSVHYRAADRTCSLLDGVNMPLGFSRDDAYRSATVPVGPGDRILFYSDGLSEARDPAGEFFGPERIMDFLARNAGRPADATLPALVEAAAAFAGGRAFTDDLTCVLVALGAPPPGRTAALEAASALVELPRLRAFVADFCARAAVPPLGEEASAALQLAVNEAAVNVMKHAYEGRSDGRLALEAADEGDRVVVRLRHRGRGFRREEVAPPRFDGTAEGGFGVYIIEQSVDEVRYGPDGCGGHEIVLTKRKASQGGGSDGSAE